MSKANDFNLETYIELYNKPNRTELENNQLLSYQALVESQIIYNRKAEYFSLIKDFLSQKIQPNIFRAEFLEMLDQDSDSTEILTQDFEKLSRFSIDLNQLIDPFSDLINLLYDISMIAIEFGPDDESGISEDEFKNSIEKAFSNPKLFQ